MCTAQDVVQCVHSRHFLCPVNKVFVSGALRGLTLRRSNASQSRRAVAHVPGVRVYCTGCGAVRGASVSSCVVLWLFCGWGAAEGLTRKVGCLPTLRGGPHAVAAPATWTDLLGARAERVPDCSSYLSRIPWSAADSRLSIHPRDSVDRAAWAVSPRKRVSCLLERQRCLRVDLLAGGLEAFPLPKLRWSREEPVS